MIEDTLMECVQAGPESNRIIEKHSVKYIYSIFFVIPVFVHSLTKLIHSKLEWSTGQLADDR